MFLIVMVVLVLIANGVEMFRPKHRLLLFRAILVGIPYGMGMTLAVWHDPHFAGAFQHLLAILGGVVVLGGCTWMPDKQWFSGGFVFTELLGVCMCAGASGEPKLLTITGLVVPAVFLLLLVISLPERTGARQSVSG